MVRARQRCPACVACAWVFDGHRGPEAADFAAQRFVEALRAQWAKAGSPEQALRRAFVALDDAFRRQQVLLSFPLRMTPASGTCDAHPIPCCVARYAQSGGVGRRCDDVQPTVWLRWVGKQVVQRWQTHGSVYAPCERLSVLSDCRMRPGRSAARAWVPRPGSAPGRARRLSCCC